MKVIKNIICVIIIAFIIWAIFYLINHILSYQPTDPSILQEQSKTAEVGNLEEIYETHARNIPKYKDEYEGKYFKFTGTVQHISDNYAQIESQYVCADVYFGNKDDLKKISPDEVITYYGKIDYGLSLQVKDAIIVQND